MCTCGVLENAVTDVMHAHAADTLLFLCGGKKGREESRLLDRLKASCIASLDKRGTEAPPLLQLQ